MNGIRKVAGLAMVAALCLIFGNGPSAMAQAQAAAARAGRRRGKAAVHDGGVQRLPGRRRGKSPAQQIKCLDDFVSKYPNSALLIYVYPLYYQAYSQLKNYPKVIEYADKLVALGDKVDAGARYQALYAHCFAYSAMTAARNRQTPHRRRRARTQQSRA